jgi:hypothetical protein
MPHDIASDIYRYLARDWGLKEGTDLTAAKKLQLTREIIKLRKAYRAEKQISYHKPNTRRAYLAAFGPRYAYVLYRCLNRRRAAAKEILSLWHRGEGVVCLMGGGPACELIGLLDWLYAHNIKPRYLRVIIMDREGYWRTFHNFLFADILGKRFGGTLIIPSYESVDFPVPTGKKFDPMTVNYNFAQLAHLAEARLISVVNCLSELPDHRGFECHLRMLLRIARHPQLVVCADSAAKKRRPRMKWLTNAFHTPKTFLTTDLLSEITKMRFRHLKLDDVTLSIFNKNGAPRWENSLSRWVNIQRSGRK